MGLRLKIEAYQRGYRIVVQSIVNGVRMRTIMLFSGFEFGGFKRGEGAGVCCCLQTVACYIVTITFSSGFHNLLLGNVDQSIPSTLL
jgi:hypothetical protein